jgi:hypothetical protein
MFDCWRSANQVTVDVATMIKTYLTGMKYMKETIKIHARTLSQNMDQTPADAPWDDRYVDDDDLAAEFTEHTC